MSDSLDAKTREEVGAEIHPLLEKRWSPYAFSSRPVSDADLLKLMEAARWTMSSYNEQPWRYLVATRDDNAAFDKLLSCLVEANQAWAKNAPVLMLGFHHTAFSRNGKANGVSLHDLGAASALLTVQATALGLHVHQMAGIDKDRIRELFKLPEAVEPATAIAIGYLAGEGDEVDDELRDRDSGAQARRPAGATFFHDAWDRPHPLAG